VNFTGDALRLEGQLLGLVIQHEQPALEKQKSHLLRVEEDLKVQLAGLEKTLLETLATSTGNILENEALIQSLDETKAKGHHREGVAGRVHDASEVSGRATRGVSSRSPRRARRCSS
jgi:hypothetical protein